MSGTLIGVVVRACVCVLCVCVRERHTHLDICNIYMCVYVYIYVHICMCMYNCMDICAWKKTSRISAMLSRHFVLSTFAKEPYFPENEPCISAKGDMRMFFFFGMRKPARRFDKPARRFDKRCAPAAFRPLNIRRNALYIRKRALYIRKKSGAYIFFV